MEIKIGHDTLLNMGFAGFYTEADAQKWRGDYGGWIYVGNNGRIVWFSLDFTPSQILTHSATHGTDGGRLI